jgi:hypothetical protein
VNDDGTFLKRTLEEHPKKYRGSMWHGPSTQKVCKGVIQYFYKKEERQAMFLKEDVANTLNSKRNSYLDHLRT